ncbi:MAG: septum formation inhibitor Maf [Myxococcaceae bacterium]|nr:septum formation inhibitor Maf [Myxococcaceae bacterium]
MRSAAPQSFVLASGSPRRRELLQRLGLDFTVQPADLDESLRAGEAPHAYVERLARAKAAAVPGDLVLAADTTVAVGNEILGKPVDEADARRMLGLLSGREHSVFTGIATKTHARVVQTRVGFKALTEGEIAWYVATTEPYDKAGGYALQGLAAAFVVRIDGSPTNVIGLPLVETLELLRTSGLKLPF